MCLLHMIWLLVSLLMIYLLHVIGHLWSIFIWFFAVSVEMVQIKRISMFVWRIKRQEGSSKMVQIKIVRRKRHQHSTTMAIKVTRISLSLNWIDFVCVSELNWNGCAFGLTWTKLIVLLVCVSELDWLSFWFELNRVDGAFGLCIWTELIVLCVWIEQYLMCFWFVCLNWIDCDFGLNWNVGN